MTTPPLEGVITDIDEACLQDVLEEMLKYLGMTQ